MPKVTSKPAGKMKIQAGPSGKMQKFKPVGNQVADTTAVKGSGGTSKSFGSKVSTGGSGKMHKFEGVKPVKPA